MYNSLGHASSASSRSQRELQNHQVATTTATPSNVSLFITNLKLLSLDLQEDWPNITAQTFSTKNGQQNQRHRIRCAEWALYQLFTILDPEVACTKLQPFFPPLEPLQSLNLRSALLRCLDQAKKNGVISQDIMLRKTLLDECKGDKFEELLANFSHAVLKKTMSDRKGQKYEAIALRLALENYSYKGEIMLISSLILAHKVSLRQHLIEKNQLRVKYRDFSELLSSIEHRLKKKKEQLNKKISMRALQNHDSEEEFQLHQERKKASCSENQNWLQKILDGEVNTKVEPYLKIKFDELWDHALNGTLCNIENSVEPNLLEKLDKRLHEQDLRLARWRSLENKLGNPINSYTEKKLSKISEKRESINLDFTQHQNLQLGDFKLDKSPYLESVVLKEYNQLIDNLKFELGEVEKNGSQREQIQKLNQRTELEKETCVVKQRLNSYESIIDQDVSHPTSNAESQPRVDNNTSKAAQQDRYSRIPKFSKEQRPKAKLYHVNDNDLRLDENKADPTSNIALKDQSSVSIVPKTSSFLAKSRNSAEEELDPAKQILDGISLSSPSPKKSSIPPLAERTLLSMARMPLSQSLKTHDETNDIDSSIVVKSSNLEVESDSFANLVQRTRNSMAGFEAAQKKAQLDRRRSVKEEKKQRKVSHLQKVEEKKTTRFEDDTKVELIDGDYDYESIFKSRPKIKNSPIVSSQSSWHEDDHK
ncbi:hypothetical protein HI914_07486 [Erysiphe necator]|nr:hypothetical protein HI914_07486 [Erysiphe necator]